MTAPLAAVEGQLDLAFARDADGVTRVVRRRVRYPYVFLKPFWFGDRPPGIATAMIQSSSGGLFGGERLSQRISLERGAAAHVTNQAATVVHAMREHAATEQDVDLELGSEAYLEYLPEPAILFPDAGLAQRVRVALDPTAVLLYADGIVRHDPWSRDAPFGLYRNSLEVSLASGSLLLADRSEVTGSEFDTVLRGPDGPWSACGLFAMVAPTRSSRSAAVVAAIDAGLDALVRAGGPRVYAACVEAPHEAGVVCRIVANDGAGLRAALDVCWRTVRLAMTGAAAPRRRK